MKLKTNELCAECGKKLSKKDIIAQKTLCPNCLVVEVKHDGAENSEGNHVEANQGEATINNAEIIENPLTETPSITGPENGSIPEHPEIPAANDAPPAAANVVKPGQAIRDRFAELVEQGKISDEVIAALTDKEATAKANGVRYAFLKEFDSSKPIKELAYINGAARYSSKPIVVNGKEYLVTNDLYAKTLQKFNAWADQLGK